MEANGKEIAITQTVKGDILLCNILVEMKFARIENNKKVAIPKHKLYNKHFFITSLILLNEFVASSSETILTQAKLIPERARVIPKEYVDINNWYNPTASLPILLEM